MKLTDYSQDSFSQFGEDGMIAKIFSVIGAGDKVCVEFGAADGLSCSNTAQLWRNGWTALLIEGDKYLFDKLCYNTVSYRKRCRAMHTYITPTGPCTVDNALSNNKMSGVDFMSIDVDGIDYLVWEHMETRPRVICIEYNQSIPPHISLHQTTLTDQLGASAKALIKLGQSKGYSFIGMNKANLFFVVDEEDAFATYERDLSRLFPYEGLSYAATDYRSRAFVIGSPPWGVSSEPYTGSPAGDPIQIMGTTADLVRTVEIDHGTKAVLIAQDWNVSPAAKTDIGVENYERLFGSNYPLVILDVANQADLEQCRWVEVIANKWSYRLQIVRKDLFVFTKALDSDSQLLPS